MTMPLMHCEFCGAEFQPRTQGSRQRFCSGSVCRRAFDRRARELGAKALRRRAQKSPKPRSTAEDKVVQALSKAARALRRLAPIGAKEIAHRRRPRSKKSQNRVKRIAIIEARAEIGLSAAFLFGI
jgi:hypothetical protein